VRLTRLKLLRKNFVGSRPSSSPSSSGPVHVLRYRTEVLGAMKEWITAGGGAQDCLDDAPLYETVRTFLDTPLDRSELELLPSNDDPELLQSWDALETMKKNTLSMFMSHTLRPPALTAADPRPAAAPGHVRNFGSQVPDIDLVTAEDFVDNLNAMAFAAFSNVIEEVSPYPLLWALFIVASRTCSPRPICSKYKAPIGRAGSRPATPVTLMTLIFRRCIRI